MIKYITTAPGYLSGGVDFDANGKSIVVLIQYLGNGKFKQINKDEKKHEKNYSRTY